MRIIHHHHNNNVIFFPSIQGDENRGYKKEEDKKGLEGREMDILSHNLFLLI